VQIKDRQKLLVILTITVAALFLADLLVLEPLWKAWKAREGKLNALRGQIARGRVLVQRERGLRNHWEEMTRKALTNNLSAADQRMFGAIDSWAQDTGVIINAITPGSKQDNDEYSTYDWRVDASGDIGRLSRFLYRAEREPLALRIQGIELSARDKDGQQLTLALQLSSLLLTPPPK
jgi:hypothetical protein